MACQPFLLAPHHTLCHSAESVECRLVHVTYNEGLHSPYNSPRGLQADSCSWLPCYRNFSVPLLRLDTSLEHILFLFYYTLKGCLAEIYFVCINVTCSCVLNTSFNPSSCLQFFPLRQCNNLCVNIHIYLKIIIIKLLITRFIPPPKTSSKCLKK